MISDQTFPQSDLPEWRRSGRFVLIALALHLAVLFYPLGIAIGKLEMPQAEAVMVHLVQAMSAAPADPRPVAPMQPTPPSQQRHVTTPRPVLAMPAEQAMHTAPFSVPEAVSPPAPQLVAAVTANNPPATVSAARFDAAYLGNPEAKYPTLSRRLGEEGKVLLKVRVSAEGLAAAVDLEKSSNFERLDEAARSAVARWRFIPAKRGNEPIEASVIVPIVFRLEG